MMLEPQKPTTAPAPTSKPLSSAALAAAALVLFMLSR